jgi:hypothetical protein
LKVIPVIFDLDVFESESCVKKLKAVARFLEIKTTMNILVEEALEGKLACSPPSEIGDFNTTEMECF